VALRRFLDLLLELRQNPPYVASFGFCCGGAANPYVAIDRLGTSDAIYNYPVSPLLATQSAGFSNNLPIGTAVTIYCTPQTCPSPTFCVYSRK